MPQQKINIDNLRTVKNYALQEQVSTAYIYKLIKDERMGMVSIDGVKFVDVRQHPHLPTKK